MCDCIKLVETRTLNAVVEQLNGKGEYEGGNLIGTCFPIVDNKFKPRKTYSEYEFKFAPIKKDGTVGKFKKQTVQISHSFCPFCGEKHS